jgi:hypothetical protein
MPWDDDDDTDDDDVGWASKHLNSRIAFYYDLKNKLIDRGMSSRIMTLVAEAHYFQKCSEYVERQLDDSDLDSDDITPYISNSMRFGLCLDSIQKELELFENPEIRDIYKTIECPNRKKATSETSEIYMVAKSSNLAEQIEFMTKVKEIVGSEVVVQISSKLQDALNLAKASDHIYIPTGKHSIHFLEHLNDGGAIKAVASDTFCNQTHPNKNTLDPNKDAVITSHGDDSILLTFDGDFVLENVVLDCRNVRAGLVIKSGRVKLVNCLILGDDKTGYRQGFVIFGKFFGKLESADPLYINLFSGNSTLELQNCVIRNFLCGIYANKGVKLNIKNSTIEKCFVAIETFEGSSIEMTDVDITDCELVGVVVQTDQLVDGKMKTFSDFTDLEK